MASHRNRPWRAPILVTVLATVLGSGAQQPIAAVGQGLDAVRSSAPDDAWRAKASAYDARGGAGAATRLSLREARLMARAPAALRQLDRKLGVQGVVDLDPVSGTPRVIAKVDGFLTGPRTGSARTIALDYVRSHEAAFGISDATLRTLRFQGDYVSIDGTHHLAWTQERAGITVFGAGLRINVTRDGRVINVLGSPIAGLTNAPTTGSVTASGAVAIATRDAHLSGRVTGPAVVLPSGLTRIGPPTATKVFFGMPAGTRLAYQTIVWGRQGMYLTVVDARRGTVLYRQGLTHDSKAKVFENYPNAPAGGTQHTVDLGKYLFATNRLFGNNAWVYTDTNDDNVGQGREEIRPNKDGDWLYTFHVFTNQLNSPCVAKFECAWDSRLNPLTDPKGSFSWKTNRKQSGTNLFWLLNRYHDHLAKAPIGFNEAAGNFEAFNASGNGFGGDPVLGQGMDGANTLDIGLGLNGLPDPNHTDNANMSTPPDGFAPTMQMYLWNDPVTSWLHNFAGGDPDPFIQADGSDEADIVFHEYTHGLSNRLVVDASGFSTLGGVQAGAMGEAWSDWYAMDFLVNRGLFTDTVKAGQLRVGHYVEAGADLIRSEPIDCPVGTTSLRCAGTDGAGSGGYTYGDYGLIAGQAEVHADGEIWGQTLWDLRSALGSATTEGLVTRAMELSPANPSFLDERNAILQADQVLNGGDNEDTIWDVFANRGMGYFASALDGDDAAPVEDFSMPPDPGSPTGTLTGTVTDDGTTDPIEGAVVAFGGHSSGFAGSLVDTTDVNGDYEIDDIFVGTYPGVNALAAGYDRLAEEVTIAAGANVQDYALARDWASSSGGATIDDFTGPDYTAFGCGPGGAIDQSLGTGWGSSTDTDDAAETGDVTPKTIVIALPVAVDISSLVIDPGRTCGDALSASMHDFTVETSTNGTTWNEAATGTFYAGDVGTLNDVPLAGGTDTGVLFVRLTMESPMVPSTGTVCNDNVDCPPGTGGVALRCGPDATDPGNFSGCAFMDMSELEVYGLAS
jgi:hypothetical protein